MEVAGVEDYLTSEQIRAARAMLRLSVDELAKLSGVAAPTIASLESSDGPVGDNRHGPAGPLRQALEQAGIAFIDADDEGGPGLRLAGPARVQQGIRPENLTAANDD
ncbi:MAG: DNA-binding protein [Rhizobiaceae bacterium]|nr:DNA-binding protein [Rhizobiaceae bacterium]